MAFSKIIFNNSTLVDLTDATADSDTVLNNYTAYGADGNKITGSAQPGDEVTIIDSPDAHGGTVRDIVVQDSVMLQGEKNIILSSQEQTVLPDTGYDGFASAVVEPVTDEFWERPSDWPPMANGYDSKDFEGVYFVYDLRSNTDANNPDYWAIKATTTAGTYDVDHGHILSDGTFVVDSTSSYASNATADGFFPVWDEESDPYYVIRMKPSAGNLTFAGLVSPTAVLLQTLYPGASINDGNIARMVQMCVEVYGRLPFVTGMGSAFKCNTLIHADLRDLVSLTGAAAMFQSCRQLEKIDGLSTWSTGNLTNAENMFQSCYKLQSVKGIENWDVTNLKSMTNMFTSIGVRELDLSHWTVTSALTGASYVFRDMRRCPFIKTFGGDVSSLTDFTDVFRDCHAKNVEINWQNLNGTSYSYFFHTAEDMVNFELDWSKIGFNNVKNLNAFFYSCHWLKRIDLRGKDTSKVTTMADFAYNCSSLKTADFTGCDFSAVTNTNGNQFSACRSLVELKGFVYYQSFTLTHSNLMPATALVEVLTNLPTVTSKTITLGSTNKAKLSADQIAIATAKGWSVA